MSQVAAHEDLKLQDRYVSAAMSVPHTSPLVPCYAQSVHIHIKQVQQYMAWFNGKEMHIDMEKCQQQ